MRHGAEKTELSPWFHLRMSVVLPVASNQHAGSGTQLRLKFSSDSAIPSPSKHWLSAFGSINCAVPAQNWELLASSSYLFVIHLGTSYIPPSPA